MYLNFIISCNFFTILCDRKLVCGEDRYLRYITTDTVVQKKENNQKHFTAIHLTRYKKLDLTKMY
jgi:hypothetical protein